MDINLLISNKDYTKYTQAVCDLIEISAKVRGTGIARRKVSYIEQKINAGQAVIVLKNDQLIGFCYIETWSHGKYVANSGLVVHPDFRKLGLARKIKAKAFNLARTLFPNAKVFGITTSPAVMKINSELGYLPVPFSDLTQDDTFWKGCQSCPNYDILKRNDRKICLCTGMLALSKNEELNNKKEKNNATK